MTGTPLAGADERTVRAARRFGRIGLAITIFWLLIAPVSALTFGAPITPPWAMAPIFVLYLVAVGLHVWRIRELVTSLGKPAQPWFMASAAMVGVALALVGLATSYTGFMWSLVAGVLLGDIVGGLRARWVVVWVAASTVVVLGGGYLVSAALYETLPFEATPWFSVAIASIYIASMWTVDFERLWWLKAVTDLDDSRRVAADLATARERLRLADDLHDILGHALEVVAFKSELAARLLDADPARAAAEMEEVQRVARESLTEVRSLVRDTRSIDLVTELAGARAVLDSAGIRLVVHGEPGSLGATARNVFGRVLREAMTNVLRHAQPSNCTIEIDVQEGTARLRVVNDGVLPTHDVDTGTGLVALGRYLDEHSGSLESGLSADGTFHLDARLPVAR
ncbi:sensor histidine kinase [Pseudonocardia sp. TRM90224]|uniref:sensor histidine kinase n=1 Tax=Pseudonocardia sp. TRM90224 TaxID=2812678 RepID=UPI001E5AE79D|nr:histidine kinase [Pseudonocardia sp. TRM90224]